MNDRSECSDAQSDFNLDCTHILTWHPHRLISAFLFDHLVSIISILATIVKEYISSSTELLCNNTLFGGKL